MHNDAKFGLLVGLALVLGAAVLFFQKEPGPAANAAAPPAAPAAVSSRPDLPSAAAMLPSPAPLPRPSGREVEGRPASRQGSD
jgi:hypothetical protein